MNAYGSASDGRNVAEGYFSLNTTVVSSGASTELTISYQFCRALNTPGRGKMISCQLAATSCAVSGEPSWKCTPVRIWNVKVLLPSVIVGCAVHRSQANLVVFDGSSGSTRISTL